MLGKKFIASIFLGCMLTIANGLACAVDDPVVLLRKVTKQIMGELSKNSAQYEQNPHKLYEVVDHLVIPHVDFTEMAKWVAGRTAWGKATPNLQQEFVNEFKVLVVNTYATALYNYTDETIEFLPQKYNTAKPRVQISSKIKRQHKDDISLDYRLIRHGDTWRVYDIIIEGISILQGFQAQFSNDIRRQGLESVTKKINHHNNQDPGKV